jgi:hypothetical protein
MNATRANSPAKWRGTQEISLWDLTLPSVRLTIARVLVAFSFVWPFFNYRLIDPDGTVEINFLPVFLAALILPEVTLRDKWSILLALPVFAVALIWANPTAPIRLAIGIVPLHFIINLTRHLREQNEDLLPPNLAYRALQMFVGFSALQTIEFQLFPIIPGWLTAALVTILPRYTGVPGDDFGIRGVQGWASEPSGAAVTCAAFALVAIFQRPDRRWRVLGLVMLLTYLNKSIYALVLLVLLGLGCVATLQNKKYSFLAIVPLTAAAFVVFLRSNRLADLHTNLVVGGMNSASNRELARFVQIFSPLQQFPEVYKPPILFGSFVMEPMGLLPLVAGYGSVLGLIWLAYILWHTFSFREVPLLPLAFVAWFILLMMTAPDLIPAVVAFAVFMVPRNRKASSNCVSAKRVILCH